MINPNIAASAGYIDPIQSPSSGQSPVRPTSDDNDPAWFLFDSNSSLKPIVVSDDPTLEGLSVSEIADRILSHIVK